jgi:autophagy-related protein 5
LLPRLRTFFSNSLIEPNSEPYEGWFEFEGVPLKWHYPIGLLFDLYAGAAPASKTVTRGDESPESSSPLSWRLVLHFSNWPDENLVRLDANGMVMNDAFINSVKEADFLRNGTAKAIMSLSKEDSSNLWRAVEEGEWYLVWIYIYSMLFFWYCFNTIAQVDLPSFQRISNILLPQHSQPFRNVPIRIFLPLPPDNNSPSLKVVQSPLPPSIPASSMQASQILSSRTGPTTQPQTVGTILHTLLPNLFPSRRTPVLAKPVLHGAVIPMSAPIEEVVRSSAYGDGWAYLVVRMMG